MLGSFVLINIGVLSLSHPPMWTKQDLDKSLDELIADRRGAGGGGGGFTGTCHLCGVAGHRAAECHSGGGRGGGFAGLCHVCGLAGHRAAECPSGGGGGGKGKGKGKGKGGAHVAWSIGSTPRWV